MSEVCGLLSAVLTVQLYTLSALSFVAGLLFVKTVFSWSPRA